MATIVRRWAADSIALCIQADWPRKLFHHEMGEVVAVHEYVAAQVPGGRGLHKSASRSPKHTRLLFRGLRLKVGIRIGGGRG